MSDHSLELQKSIFNRLDGDSTLQNLITDVYDFVPENTAFPYVKVGEETSLDNGTKTLQGNEHTLVIHTFSRYRGSKEVKEIMSRIYALLHESSLSVTGASLVNLRFEFSDVIKENDGFTSHGLQRFRAVVYDS
jgi:hypothetical protein|tara:strand:- start:3943 stop:4344 length:402 start_codon:yes stop_codon:yes gene_type:complete